MGNPSSHMGAYATGRNELLSVSAVTESRDMNHDWVSYHIDA